MPNKSPEKTKSAPKSTNPNYLRYGVIGLLIICVVAAALLLGGEEEKSKPAPKNENTVASACGPYRDDRTATINGAVFKTEVTKSRDEFAKGLGGRPCILPDQAMLFAYTKPGQYAFWMKDMKFPIDIVWVGADYKVAGIEIDVQPSTYPDRFVNKDHPAQYVLEMKANRSKELNINIGTPVTF